MANNNKQKQATNPNKPQSKPATGSKTGTWHKGSGEHDKGGCGSC